MILNLADKDEQVMYIHNEEHQDLYCLSNSGNSGGPYPEK